MGAASDSEAEDESSRVVLPERFLGKGNAKSQQSAIKLVELGPRVSLELYKVERGLCEGDVLYHKFETKSAEEAAQLKKRKDDARALKLQRKAEQDANVKRKRTAAEEKRQQKMEKKKSRLDARGKSSGGNDDDDDDESGSDGESYDDDDNDVDDDDRDGSDDEYDGEEEYYEEDEEDEEDDNDS
jgi:ribosome biogenesis protein SSF1/2